MSRLLSAGIALALLLAAGLAAAQTRTEMVLETDQDITGHKRYKKLNEVRYAFFFAGADIGAKVNAAIADCPAAGCEVRLPIGNSAFSTQIVISDRPVVLRGHGAGTHGACEGATTLTYTGSSVPIAVYSISARASVLEDFTLCNTATGTVGIDIYSTLEVRLNRVTVWPAVAFSAAGIRVGQNAVASSSITFEHVYVRGNAVGLKVGNLNALLNLIDSHFIQNATNDLVLGDSAAGYDAVGVRGVGSSFEAAANTTSVKVERAIDADLCCYFENDGSGYALDIPSSAAMADGVRIGGYFVGGAFAHSTTYAINVNLAAASLFVDKAFAFNYANPGYLVRNQSAQSIAITSARLNSTGMVATNSYTNVTEVGTNRAGISLDSNLPALNVRGPFKVIKSGTSTENVSVDDTSGDTTVRGKVITPGLTVNGDTPFTKAPRMAWSPMIADITALKSGVTFQPRQAITIEWIDLALFNESALLSCSAYPVIAIWDGSSNIITKKLSKASSWAWTGSVNVAAGTTLEAKVLIAGVGCSFASNMQLAVQYRMR